jgi:radical SAM protein with 4Fe4S-binding SPASM domain
MALTATAILSMLHEPPGDAGDNSAARLFRDKPVLWWTLERLKRSRSLDAAAILCWEDQLAYVRDIADEHEVFILTKGPARCHIPPMDGVTAARRWSDGWRGGLLQTCEFDRGFYGPWHLELATKLAAEAFVLVDPSAGLVDPHLIDALVAQAESAPDVPLVFSQAAPGLGGVLVRFDLIKQLASLKAHPGKFLHYQPQHPCRDPISEKACAQVATPLARTLHRFTLDTQRQIHRIERATLGLNGLLLSTPAEGLLAAMNDCEPIDPLPREVVLELTTRRGTKPIFAPAGHLPLDRPDLALDTAAALFEQLAQADDVRLTLAGVGDPLLAPAFFDIVALARASGIAAIHARTDLLDLPGGFIEQLAAAPIDVISIHVPATTARTYLAVMGVDGLARVIDNVKMFVEQRWRLAQATPILVPLFTKCRENLAEMEIWYDKWLPALGGAVIAGANDYAGQIPDHAVADMAPPLRRPCGRLVSRMHVLCDGTIVSCEQDVMGRQALGNIASDQIADVWAQRYGALRRDHGRGEWAKHSLCGNCREWHRP